MEPTLTLPSPPEQAGAMERVSTSDMAPERRSAADLARISREMGGDDDEDEISPTPRKSRESSASRERRSASQEGREGGKEAGGPKRSSRSSPSGDPSLGIEVPSSPRGDLPNEMPPLLVQFEQVRYLVITPWPWPLLVQFEQVCHLVITP